MNADRLFALYDRVADAPDAVGRLRRFVLDLGVRGKLVVQDPAEEPALELLHQARRSLEDRAGSASRARWKATAPVAPEEIHAEMPPGWVPARVNDTGLYVNGLAFKPADWKQSGTPIIRIQNLTDAGKGYNFAEGDFPDEVKVRSGDLLVSWSATLEAFRWERGEGVLNQHIFRVIPDDGLTTRDFLLLILKNAIRELSESDHAHGLVMTHINRGPFLNHVTLIPPLAEQHRIVAKVDELMALCDQLEAARTAREDTRDRLTKASLARLSAPGTDVPAFRSHARFAVDALPALTARADQVKHLRQTILSLAVRGRLVEQDPEDEPASELLKRIDAEKRRLVEAGVIRKLKPPPSLEGTETSFNLPEGWAWTRLGHLSQFVTSGSRGWAKHYSDEGAIFVRMGNLSKDHYRLRLDQIQRVKPPLGGEGTRTRLKSGDILISITGNVGMLGLIPDGFGEAYINQHTAMVRPMPEMKGRYLAELFRSPFAQEQFNEPQRGIKNSFRLTDVTQLSIPLPPLAEQHRIVAKVDELMALCDQLEVGLDAAGGTSGLLLDSLLQESLGSHETAINEEGRGVARVGT